MTKPDRIEFWVPGNPQPNYHLTMIPTGKGFYRQDKKGLKKAWQEALHVAAVRACRQYDKPVFANREALNLTIEIFRERTSTYAKRDYRPTGKPDLKNYIAMAEDVLEGIVYLNDSQIVSYNNCGKYFAEDNGKTGAGMHVILEIVEREK